MGQGKTAHKYESHYDDSSWEGNIVDRLSQVLYDCTRKNQGTMDIELHTS